MDGEQASADPITRQKSARWSPVKSTHARPVAAPAFKAPDANVAPKPGPVDGAHSARPADGRQKSSRPSAVASTYAVSPASPQSSGAEM